MKRLIFLCVTLSTLFTSVFCLDPSGITPPNRRSRGGGVYMDPRKAQALLELEQQKAEKEAAAAEKAKKAAEEKKNSNPLSAIKMMSFVLPSGARAVLTLSSKESITQKPFSELITDKLNKNGFYVLAIAPKSDTLQENYLFDAQELTDWFKTSDLNPAGDGSTKLNPDAILYYKLQKPLQQGFKLIGTKKSWFENLKKPDEFDLEEDESITGETFSELIQDNLKQNNLYILAQVKTNDSKEYIHYFDAIELNRWFTKKNTNPLTGLSVDPNNVTYYKLEWPNDGFEAIGTKYDLDIEDSKNNAALKEIFSKFK